MVSAAERRRHRVRAGRPVDSIEFAELRAEVDELSGMVSAILEAYRAPGHAEPPDSQRLSTPPERNHLRALPGRSQS
jgi:hypothetical protein